MKRVLLAVALVAMLAVSVSAVQAVDWYFAQDDFTLTFGTPGNPGSAGSTIVADGLLKYWNNNQVYAKFEISGSTTLGAQPYGVGQFITWYDNATLTLKNKVTSAVMWTGTGKFCTIVNANGSQFSATLFNRPYYENQPVKYQSVGYGSFTGSGLFDFLSIDWLGTYNWSYDVSVPGSNPPMWTNDTTQQYGNIQAKVSTAIPEAGSVMLGMMGLGSVLGFVRFRKK